MAKNRSTKVDARAIFEHAVPFLSTDNLLRTLPPKNPQLRQTVAVPSMVLSAFGCELFLKCILTLEEVGFKDTHSLHELFGQLKHKTKRRIERHWDDKARPQLLQLALAQNLILDLPNAIYACRDAFVFLRYAYEDPSKVLFYLQHLPEILFDVIVEMRPDWAPPQIEFDPDRGIVS